MEIMIDHVTDYSGFKKIYFLKIIFKIRKIIKIYNFKNILDYGCGKKILSSKIQFGG